MFRKTVRGYTISVAPTLQKVTIYRREGKVTKKFGEYPFNYDFNQLDIPDEVKKTIYELVSKASEYIREKEVKKSREGVKQESKVDLGKVLDLINEIISTYDKFINLLIDYNTSLIQHKVSTFLENEVVNKTVSNIDEVRDRLRKVLSLEYNKLRYVLSEFTTMFNIESKAEDFYSLLEVKDIPIDDEKAMNIVIRIPSLRKMYMYLRHVIIEPKLEELKKLLT